MTDKSRGTHLSDAVNRAVSRALREWLAAVPGRTAGELAKLAHVDQGSLSNIRNWEDTRKGTSMRYLVKLQKHLFPDKSVTAFIAEAEGQSSPSAATPAALRSELAAKPYPAPVVDGVRALAGDTVMLASEYREMLDLVNAAFGFVQQRRAMLETRARLAANASHVDQDILAMVQTVAIPRVPHKDPIFTQDAVMNVAHQLTAQRREDPSFDLAQETPRIRPMLDEARALLKKSKRSLRKELAEPADVTAGAAPALAESRRQKREKRAAEEAAAVTDDAPSPAKPKTRKRAS